MNECVCICGKKKRVREREKGSKKFDDDEYDMSVIVINTKDDVTNFL